MALTIFYLAAAIAVLLIGIGVVWAAWVAVSLLTDIRQNVLPQVQLLLTEVQKNLDNLEDLTQDVDSTVEEATQLVQTANRTVQSVERGIGHFNRRVAVPFMIQSASAIEGVKAGWRTLRSKRAPAPPIAEVEEGETVEILRPSAR
ncbi:MAG TPA: hypothetical protein V6D47_16875 [Oscillatoriaceae cyanobacterium]